jgi:hypothetical protein
MQPVIIFYIIQEGVRAVDPAITKPFRDIGPLSVEPIAGTYSDLAAWTGIAANSPPCQKAGFSNPRFPLYLQSYNIAAQRRAYDLFAAQANGTTPFANSILMLEAYSMQGVRAVDSASSAFAYRSDNLLVAPLISYAPTGPELDRRAADLGLRLRQILHQGSGRSELHAYLNYAFGNETPQQLYGAEDWRQRRLRDLKRKYDPSGRFSFYGPIA